MKRKHMVLLSLDIGSAVFLLCMTIIGSVLANSLTDQDTAGRWGGGERYSQVSVYTALGSELSIDGIFMTRDNVEKKLTENSFASEREGARVWADAFSSYQMSISVSSGRASSEAAMIITGGDFFLFHPQEMLSGYYYSDSDTMYDRIVIDDVLAWQLFGSSDVAGMPVTINGKYFYIAGVYKQSENKYIKEVCGEKPRMFMPYQGYSLISESGAVFSCYEACLPDPVTGIGMNIISGSVGLDEDECRIVENSARYGLKNRFKLLGEMKTRSVVDIPLIYPYWENAARMTEDRSALILVFQIISLIAPVFTVIYLFRALIKNKKKIFERIKGAAEKGVSKIRRGSEKVGAEVKS